MPRPCTVCGHPSRDAIDRALVAPDAANRAIARQFGLSKDAVARHRAEHLPQRLARGAQAAQAAQAVDLLAEVQALRRKAYGLLLKAEQMGDLRTALQGVREARGCLELLAEMEGELDRRPQVSLVLSGEWLAVRGVLFAALRDHPEAR